MTDADAEYTALVEQLTEAGLVEEYVTDDDQPGVRLTSEGEKVARQLALTDDAGQDALMNALLGGRTRPAPRGMGLQQGAPSG